jgi:membrane-bound lytic murein transglycosylase D
MTVYHLPTLFLIGVLASGCQLLPSGQNESDDDVLDSQKLSLAAGDEGLKEAVESGTEAQQIEAIKATRTKLDDAIEPSMKETVENAREKLDEPAAKVAEAGGANKAEQKAQPEPDLWARLRAGFALDHDVDQQRVQSQLNWYKSHPRYMDRVAERGSRYLYYILNEAEKRGLPTELVLLPIVESAFDPFAYSHGRAAGLWQFIPSTGHVYDLNQSWWHDQRRDVIAASDGALQYLDALTSRFDGDIMLGLASYNSGAGTVLGAIRRNKSRGKPTDYWSLNLPRETEAYVPKLIAFSKIINDPDAYGITLPDMPDEPYFDVIETGSQIDLAQAAELAEVDVEEIYLLNPAYNRWATSPDGPHRLLIPVEKSETFRRNLAQLDPKERVSWKNYRVEAGDSLIRIARKFGTTPAVIKQVNRMSSNLIRVDQRLLIPTSTQASGSYVLSAGERLMNQQQATGKRNDGNRQEHLVQSGDTFWDISREYDVGVRELAKWNGMAPGDPLRPGQTLVIWSDKPRSKTVTLASRRSDSGMVRKVGYRVRKGDSLSAIASRFNVNVNDIAGWNQLNTNNYLQPGQSLVLYVDIRRSP